MTSRETVLITGCSDNGIGSGLALQFQQKGYHVFATARDVSKMSKLKDLPNVTLLQLDVVESSHITAAVEAVTKVTGGTLDYLISNAGQNHFMTILDEDIANVKNLFDVNVFGPITLTKAFSALVIKAKGVIAFITSISGYLNIPYMGTYAATKRSIELIAETLRLEIAPFGVTVTSIVTGGVQTMGQTYFGNLSLPVNSLYKPIEATIKHRAQGGDAMARMPLDEYATAVAEALIKRTASRFWYGQSAEMVKMSTTAVGVPQDTMDAGATMGTGLEELVKGNQDE